MNKELKLAKLKDAADARREVIGLLRESLALMLVNPLFASLGAMALNQLFWLSGFYEHERSGSKAKVVSDKTVDNVATFIIAAGTAYAAGAKPNIIREVAK